MLLLFLFALLAVFLTIKAVEKNSVYKLILASACYFVSLMSKETGTTFLIIIPVILFVFTNAGYKKILNISLMALACCV